MSYCLSEYEKELMESNGVIGELYAHDLLLHYLSVGDSAGLEWMRKWYPPVVTATRSIEGVDARKIVSGAIAVVTDTRIIRAIAEEPERLLQLSWRDFERFTAELLEELGYTGVSLGEGSKDGGVDVTAFIEHPFGVEKLIVQCKRYRVRKVGEVCVKQLLANIKVHRADRGLIVTTTTLTKPARVLVDSRRYRMSAADIDDIHKLLREVPPNKR